MRLFWKTSLTFHSGTSPFAFVMICCCFADGWFVLNCINFKIRAFVTFELIHEDKFKHYIFNRHNLIINTLSSAAPSNPPYYLQNSRLQQLLVFVHLRDAEGRNIGFSSNNGSRFISKNSSCLWKTYNALNFWLRIPQQLLTSVFLPYSPNVFLFIYKCYVSEKT